MKPICLLFALLSAWPIFAAHASVNGSVTLDDVFQKAKSADPNILKAKSKIEEMSQTGVLARSNFFPSLALDSTIYSNQFLLTQKIWDGGATLAGSELATHQEKSADWEKKSETQKLYLIVAAAYYDALFVVQKSSVMEEDDGRVETAIEYAMKQLKFGAIGKNILMKAKVAQRKTAAALFEVHNEKVRSARILARLTRQEDFSLDSLKDKLNPHALPSIPDLTPKVLSETVVSQSPDLQVLQFREQTEDDRKNISLAEDRIQAYFLASYAVGSSTPPNSINPIYKNGYSMGAFISLPLFSGFSTFAKKHIAEERKVQIHEDMDSTSSTLDYDAKEIVRQLKQDAVDIKSLDAEVKDSDEIWKEINSEYHVGLGSPDLWFDSIANLETWKLQRLEKTRDYMIKYATLTAMLKGDLE